ncbi:hypothetical protein LJB93_03115 [Desulfovibrio sp. OttesenSCG-928-F07]|nr:hypothetical protein [Desulfovibrio sp. OttesenSCG-928-F07]
MPIKVLGYFYRRGLRPCFLRAGTLCLLVAVLFAGSFIFTGSSMAATPSYLPYPSNDSSIINPYGVTDETAMLLYALQPYYQQATGKTLHTKTVSGRGGATGWGQLSSQPGDGYHLAATNLQNLILRSMARRPVYQLNDVFNFCILAEAPLVLWVPEGSPFKTIGELAASARAYPEQLIIAGTGSMSTSHISTLQFNFLSGSKTLYLPYLGTATAMQAATAGQAHAAWGYPLSDFGRQMRMRPLAVTAPARLKHMIDVPTFDEAGIGLFVNNHFGLALPGTASTNTRQEVSAVFNAIVANPEFRAGVEALGFSLPPEGASDVNMLLANEVVKLSALLDDYPME